MTDHETRPSLRMAEIAITGFRTFRSRTIIPLGAGDQADPLVVFHGDNGSGKSNALAALDLFFRALDFWTSWRSGVDVSMSPEVRIVWGRTESGGFRVNRRDVPPGYLEAMAIEVRFADAARLGTLRVVIKPSAADAFVSVGRSRAGRLLSETTSEEDVPLSPKESRDVRQLLIEPVGPGSRPFFLLDAHRRGPWTDQEGEQESFDTLSPQLSTLLLSLKQSLEPAERQRWKAFVSMLGKFPTLKGMDISIDRRERGARAELTFEVPGVQVLLLAELSSGEQQVVALCAALLTARASIVAVAEPEMSLSEVSQKLLRESLEQQTGQGSIDQILLESHSQLFDGPEVVRFVRTEQRTSRVERMAASAKDSTLTVQAKEAGAEQQWVTAEGFTQLPREMRQDLGMDRGGMVWFLKDQTRRWAAWTTEELDREFGFSGKPSSEG